MIMKKVNEVSNIQDMLDKPEKVQSEITDSNINLDQETVNNLISEVSDTIPKKRGRKSKSQKTVDEKEAEQMKVLDLIFKSSIALIVVNLTSLVSFFTKDKRWDAEPDEAEMIGQALIASLDHHFPNWKMASPDLALATAILGYVSKRVFSVKEQ
jgi:hypothetical protein